LFSAARLCSAWTTASAQPRNKGNSHRITITLGAVATLGNTWQQQKKDIADAGQNQGTSYPGAIWQHNQVPMVELYHCGHCGCCCKGAACLP
jgi:hypothetical protein